MKGQATRGVPAVPEAGELKRADQSETGSAKPEGLHESDPLAEGETGEQQRAIDDSDAETTTTYSVSTVSDDPKQNYLQVFAQRLAKDMKKVSDEFCFESIKAEHLDPVLREFAWKLYDESSTPFQWEASVIIHKKRK